MSLKMKPLANAISFALLASATSFTMTSASWAEESDSEEAEKITVTGSRIKRSQVEGAQPLTVITAEDIEKQGFTTAFEALSFVTQFTGAIQDDQFAGGFTQAANGLDLRALGPGRTLTLFNGRRATDYPLPFNGQSNVVNLANVPSIIIERIEILATGASAIYGSDAVAGVINIVLKDDYEGLYAQIRGSDTKDGGGETYRLQLAAGHDFGRFRFSVAAEYLDRDPIYRYQRDYQDSFLDDPTLASPDEVVNSRTFLILDPFRQNGTNFTYIDPGAAACEPLSNLQRGSIEYSFRPGRGNYCGTNQSVAEATIRNGKENATLYGNWTLELTDDFELYGSVIYTDSETTFNVGSQFWSYSGDSGIGGGYFINQASADVFGVGGRGELWQRIFTPEEMGGADVNNNNFEEELIDFSVGFRGTIAEYDIDIIFSQSQYDTTRERRLLLATESDAFFLGSRTGSADFIINTPDGPLNFGQFDTFNANTARVYQPLTPQEYASISAIDSTKADSLNQTISASLSGELFEFPTSQKPVGFAVVAEFGTQDYDINIDPGLVNGRFLNFTGTGGEGDRDRLAFGIETSFPILETLDLNLAGRWDEYDDITDVDDATTYNIGLEWRPIDSFMMRGSYATSFRAPDMHFVFADDSGFFQTVTDFYLCRRDEPGVPTPACTNSGVNIEGSRSGNPRLEEEEGLSYTVGFVWDVTDASTLTVDYYKIELENVVTDRSVTKLLETEADCRLGVTEGGQAVDINSAECQDVISRITRNRFIEGDTSNISEALQTVSNGPINATQLKTRGVDANYIHRVASDFGDFSFRLTYTHVFAYEEQEFAGDPVEDIRDDLQNFDFRSRANAQINWVYQDWASSFSIFRTGSIPNWAETKRDFGNTLYNWSAFYNFTEEFQVGLTVVNLLDERPPEDPTYDTYPYYSTLIFNPYGREIGLQASYEIDI